MTSTKKDKSKRVIKGIRILGKLYTVQRVARGALDSDDCCGACEDAKQAISIAEGLPADLEQDTLIHETFHAIDYAMSLKMSERQISALATGFYAVLKDNPEFSKYITDAKPTM